MIAYEKICQEHRPDWIIMVGDVNPTAACAMVGAKLWIPVIHLEAGLRSGDRQMPEEINRLVADAIGDVLWTPSADADENLAREGVAAEHINLIGNIMINSFEMLRDRSDASTSRQDLRLKDKQYGLVTLHRPSTVDQAETFARIVEALTTEAKDLPLVFVAHPRTIASLDRLGLKDKLTANGEIQLLEPCPTSSS
jgi:UDP-N-acetylglucosamine 2-epimerase (non-hydrolysing)